MSETNETKTKPKNFIFLTEINGMKMAIPKQFKFDDVIEGDYIQTMKPQTVKTAWTIVPDGLEKYVVFSDTQIPLSFFDDKKSLKAGILEGRFPDGANGCIAWGNVVKKN